MNVKVGIITQARLGSTRLPGKIFKKINGRTLLDYHLAGLRQAALPVVVATTEVGLDDQVADFCLARQIDCFRGSESDVLARYYWAATQFKFDIIVRVTSDCPLVNGHLIKQAIDESDILAVHQQYVSNTLTRTFPRGLDFEIFSYDMLVEAYQQAVAAHEREHVSPYIYKKALERAQVFHVTYPKNYSSYRLTVDTLEDFALIEKLIVEHQADQLVLEKFFQVLDDYPELKAINAHVMQKEIE